MAIFHARLTHQIAGGIEPELDVYGTCEVTLRTTLASGAVLQLYAPDLRSPFAPVQHLRAYLPNGRVYVVSAAGWFALHQMLRERSSGVSARLPRFSFFPISIWVAIPDTRWESL